MLYMLIEPFDCFRRGEWSEGFSHLVYLILMIMVLTLLATMVLYVFDSTGVPMRSERVTITSKRHIEKSTSLIPLKVGDITIMQEDIEPEHWEAHVLTASGNEAKCKVSEFQFARLTKGVVVSAKVGKGRMTDFEYCSEIEGL